MRWDFAKSPLTRALLVYFFVAALVSATGVSPATSFPQLHKDFHKVWMAWMLLAALPLVDGRWAEAGFAAGGLAAAAIGIGQALIERNSGGWARAHAFVHPVSFGEIMGLLCLGAFCARREQRAGRKRALEIALVILGAALVLSQARGALIGVAAGLLALALADKSLRKAALVALLVMPLVFLFWELMPSDHNFTAMLSRASTPGHPNPFLARLVFWDVGARIFRDHPLVGVGPGNYRLVFDQYFHGVIEGESVWGSAHNLFVHQAAERGLLGLAALGWVLYELLAGAWTRAQKRPSALNLWAFASTAAFLVMNLTEVAFQTEQVASALLFVWLLAETRQPSAR